MCDVKYEIYGECLVIIFANEVDETSCGMIRSDTDEIMEKQLIRQILFDFSHTVFCDSSGIGVILGRCKKIHSYGGKAYICGENDRIKRLLRISGVYQVVEQVENK